MPITVSAPDDEVFLIAVDVELEPETIGRIRSLFPGVSVEDAIAAMLVDTLNEADAINRED